MLFRLAKTAAASSVEGRMKDEDPTLKLAGDEDSSRLADHPLRHFLYGNADDLVRGLSVPRGS